MESGTRPLAFRCPGRTSQSSPSAIVCPSRRPVQFVDCHPLPSPCHHWGRHGRSAPWSVHPPLHPGTATGYASPSHRIATSRQSLVHCQNIPTEVSSCDDRIRWPQVSGRTFPDPATRHRCPLGTHARRSSTRAGCAWKGRGWELV